MNSVRTLALLPLLALLGGGAAIADELPRAGLYRGVLTVTQDADIAGETVAAKASVKITARVGPAGQLLILAPGSLSQMIAGKLEIIAGDCVLTQTGDSTPLPVTLRRRGFSLERADESVVSIDGVDISVPSRFKYVLTRVGN